MQIRVMALGVFRTVAAEFVVDIRDDACVRDVREALESRLSVESPRDAGHLGKVCVCAR